MPPTSIDRLSILDHPRRYCVQPNMSAQVRGWVCIYMIGGTFETLASRRRSFSLPLREDEILYRHATELQLARCELGCGAGNGLRNRLGGTVDGENAAFADALEHRACSDARTAANFKNTHAWAQRQRCDDFSQAR